MTCLISRVSIVYFSYLCGFSLAFSPNGYAYTRASSYARNTRLSSSTSSVIEKKIQAPNPRLEGLAFMLDDGTRKSHSVAENTAFVTGFFKGLSTRSAYRDLLTSLFHVYKSMEDAFDECEMEQVKALDDDKLRRIDALRVDMDYFYGDDWDGRINVSPFTQKYVERIRKVAAEKPHLLIAHQYTRYLGDLFGGQMMGGMATRSLNLNDGAGVAFYTFDEIDNAKDFITQWYSKMNALDLSDAEKMEIVDEANLVFEFNIGIFQELKGNPLKAIWSLAISSLKSKFGARL